MPRFGTYYQPRWQNRTPREWSPRPETHEIDETGVGMLRGQRFCRCPWGCGGVHMTPTETVEQALADHFDICHVVPPHVEP